MQSRGRAESVEKPPVAPKPTVLPPPKTVLQPAASKHVHNLDTAKPHKYAVKPAVAPKPPALAISEPLTSNSEHQARLQKKPEIQRHVGLLNSRNGPHPERRQPERDYVISICACAEGKCHECSPKENNRKPIQHGKDVEPCMNSKPQGSKNLAPRTWNKPQHVANPGQVLTPPLKNSVQGSSSDQPKQTRVIPNQSPGAVKSAPNLTTSNGSVSSDRCTTKKPQSSAGGTRMLAETVVASPLKVSEQALVDNRQHGQVPCKTNGSLSPVGADVRKPPLPVNKPKYGNAVQLNKTDILSENPKGTTKPILKVVKVKESTPAPSQKEIAPVSSVKPPPRENKPKLVVETQNDIEVYQSRISPIDLKDAAKKDQRLEERPNQHHHSDVGEKDMKVHKTQHSRSKDLPNQPNPKSVSKTQKNKEIMSKEEVLQSHTRNVERAFPVSPEGKPGDKPNLKMSHFENQNPDDSTPENKPAKKPGTNLKPKSKSFSPADMLHSQKKSSVFKIKEFDLPVKKSKGKQAHFTTVKNEQSVVEDLQASHNQKGDDVQIPQYRMHNFTTQNKETVSKFSFPSLSKEESVDGDDFMEGKGSDGLYEVILDASPHSIGSPGIQTQPQTQPSKIQKRQLSNGEGLYEDVDSPGERADLNGSRNVYEEIVSSDDTHSEEEIDSGSEVEEDSSAFSDKGQNENDSKRTKLAYIAREIMSSEKVFVNVLKLLHITFRYAVLLASSQSIKPVIEEKILSQILSSLPQLYELNCDLLKELENRVANWNEHSGIADIFLKKGPYLKMYSSYICEFDKNVALLEEQCRKNPAFAKVVREFESSPCCANLAVKHYMLKPVQRLPQYQLLLTDYLKNLSENSPDYKDTQAALQLVKEVATHANETMRQGDNFQKLMQVQYNLSGHHEIIKPGRVLLKKGTLKKLSRKDMQPRMFFLFNDALLYTTPLQSGQFKLNNELSLAGMKVSKPSQEGYQNELNIESVERSFILSGSSPAIRDAWLEAISNAIDNYTKKITSFSSIKSPEEGDREGSDNGAHLGSKAPIWIPDLRATMCMICTCEFTLTWRRHHCRACGKVVCQACSNNKHPLEYLKNRPARVCDQCFETLQNNSTGNQAAGSGVVSPNSKSSGGFHFRKQKKIPAALKEVSANTDESSMSGYMERTKPNKKQWKRFWFVIKNKVLYTYAASEDVAALESQPLLGFSLKEVESESQFCLYHKESLFYIFKTDDTHIYQRWIETFHEAMVL